MNKILCNNKPQGFMALINVLVASSVALVVFAWLSLTLYGENKIIVDSLNADEAYYLAHACAEEGLMRIRRDLNYSGGSIVLDAEHQCAVSINNLAWAYTLLSAGKCFDQIQSIQINFTITTQTNLLDGLNNLHNRNNLSISAWTKI